MQAVKSRNTTPEMQLRSLLFAEGYRYRLHTKTLPGKPDIVFHKRKKAIFVHGCFWHGHDCVKGKLPKTNIDFWADKINRNKTRDLDNNARLEAEGWSVLLVWQCELKNPRTVLHKTQSFLEDWEAKNSIDKGTQIE